MAKIDLERIYRQATARPDARTDALLDADTLARLAAGEHLGARHDEIVAALAGSSIHSRALQIAMDAVELPAAEREVRTPRAWSALAAGLAAGFVALVMNGPRVGDHAGTSDVAQRVDDRIQALSFEDGVVQSDPIFKEDEPGV